MPFCLSCGTATTLKVPTGDSRPRAVCDSCGYIHYENPKIICGALALHDDKVLLCRRAIEPRYGYWTLPAGFMEIGETLAQGAARETLEEAAASIGDTSLYCLYSVPAIGQVHAIFKSILIDGKFGVGEESLECALFSEAEIPWKELAFPNIKRSLEHYFNDRKINTFPIHVETLGE